MNACVCGHAVEEHPHFEACEGEVHVSASLNPDGDEGVIEPCLCAVYEPEIDDEREIVDNGEIDDEEENR